MSTAKKCMYCMYAHRSALHAFQGDHVDHTEPPLRPPHVHYDHCHFSITTCQGPGTGWLVGSFREARCIAIDGDDGGDGPGGVEQEDGLIMRGRQHVYPSTRWWSSRWTARSLTEKRGAGGGGARRGRGKGRAAKGGSCRRVCNQ